MFAAELWNVRVDAIKTCQAIIQMRIHLTLSTCLNLKDFWLISEFTGMNKLPVKNEIWKLWKLEAKL